MKQTVVVLFVVSAFALGARTFAYRSVAAGHPTDRTSVNRVGPPSASGVRGGAQLQSAPRTTADGSGEIAIRKSVTSLTIAERKEFVDAIVALKAAKSPYDPSLSYYDQFVQWHKERYACHAAESASGEHTMLMIHAGPMFLPWHREFLRRFENALRDVSGKTIAVPYWDWADPASIDSNSPTAVFREDFMGGDGDPDQQYAVTTGRFKKGEWTLNVLPEGATWSPSATPYLTRRLGRPQALPTKDQVEALLAIGDYDVPPYTAGSDREKSFRNALEGNGTGTGMLCGADGWMAWEFDLGITSSIASGRTTLHNLIHGWVGGSLSPGPARPPIRGTMVLPTSPNDPVFFLHHANVDRLWATWQGMHPGKTYEPKTGQQGNNADSSMAPFGDVNPRLVEDISNLGYRYR